MGIFDFFKKKKEEDNVKVPKEESKEEKLVKEVQMINHLVRNCVDSTHLNVNGHKKDGVYSMDVHTKQGIRRVSSWGEYNYLGNHWSSLTFKKGDEILFRISTEYKSRYDEYIIIINPSLSIDAETYKMSEEEIFLCLIELKNIVQELFDSTEPLEEVHEMAVLKFKERFV